MPKHKGGRPTKYRNSFHPLDYIVQSKQGKTLKQIASNWDVDADTVQEWRKVHPEFSVAVKKGRQFSEAWYINLGQSAMLGQAKADNKFVQFNLGAFVWLTKNLFKWSDRKEIKKDEEIDPRRPLKDVSDEELDEM